MALFLHNTLTRRVEPFAPPAIRPARRCMCAGRRSTTTSTSATRGRPWCSTCWPRCCAAATAALSYARNITDVDDKINDGARSEGVPIGELTERTSRRITKTWRALGVAPPDVEPHATEHIAADRRDDRAPDRQRPRLRGGRPRAVLGARATPTTASSRGRDPRRHARRRARRGRALQARPRRLRAVEAVRRRPARLGSARGAAAARAGTSNAPRWPKRTSARRSTSTAAASTCVFPHHENEIAQSKCAHGGKPFARYWLHNGFAAARRREDVEVARQHRDRCTIWCERCRRRDACATRCCPRTIASRSTGRMRWSSSRGKLDRLYGTLRDAGLSGR